METHTKKHILGFVGLVGVAAMTAVAYTLPTPDAAAVASASAEVTYSVEVHEKAAVTLADSLDGMVFAESPIIIKSNYSETAKLRYYLTYIDASGNQVTEQLVRTTCTSGDCSSLQYLAGADEFVLDLNDYAGYGKYQLHVVADGVQSTNEDYATFEYSAGAPADQGTDENGNPIIDIKVDDNVKYVDIQVYDEDGNPLFVDENGNPTPIRVQVDENGHIITPLPFDQYDIANGKYRIVIVYYDENGAILYTESMDYFYNSAEQRKELAVPDTGFLGLGNLNFSNPDYWIAGLAGLTALAGGAYYLSKRAKSRR